MAYQIRPDETIADGMRRLARKELRRAAEALATMSPGDEAIHEARKSVKKVRAIMSLIEADAGRLGDCRKRLRRANRTLSGPRDADATLSILKTLTTKMPRLLSEHTFASVRHRLSVNKQSAMEAAECQGAWGKVGRELEKIRQDVKGWRPDHRGFRALQAGIRSAHRRGRKRLADAQSRQGATEFHEWRKEMKGWWYALRLIQACNSSVRRDADALHRAETELGDDHNLVVLCAELSKAPSLLGGPEGLDRLRRHVNRYQSGLRKKAIAGTRAIYRRKSREYVRELERAWKTWRRRLKGKASRKPRRAAA
jgi:CHAD domain-containing protein